MRLLNGCLSMGYAAFLVASAASCLHESHWHDEATCQKEGHLEITSAALATSAAPSLLQVKASKRAPSELHRDVQGLLKLKAAKRHGSGNEPNSSQCQARFAWLHIPKCGTSFANTLIHSANTSLPANAQLESSSGVDLLMDDFLEEYPLDEWFDGCFWQGRSGAPGQHDGILQEDYDEFAGDFVGFFREPVSRAKSNWNFHTTVCNSSMWKALEWAMRRQGKTSSNASSSSSTTDSCATPVDEFAKRMQGLATKMLTGQVSDAVECYWVENECPSQVANLTLAFQRLKGFKFIGLTEHWDLSICLFHAMFGGECHDAEFSNVRPTNESEVSSKDDAFWQDFVDPEDSAVYAEASRIFWENVARYNVSLETCSTICPSFSKA